MKLAKDGDLLSFVNSHGPLSEAKTAAIFKQLISAIEHAHANGIVHRDLKLDNILVDGMIGDVPRVLVADWGFATTFDSKRPSLAHSVGSLPYAAPELHLAQAYYGPEVNSHFYFILVHFH